MVSLAKPTRKLLVKPILLFVALSPVLGARAAIALPTKTVLVLYPNNRLVPGNVAVDHGLSDVLMSDGGRSVRTFSEFLDRPEFSGDAYEDLEVAYLHGKYAASPPDAIVTVSNEALSFVVRHRTQFAVLQSRLAALRSDAIVFTPGPTGPAVSLSAAP